MVSAMIILTNYMIIVSFYFDRKYSLYFLSIQKDASEARYRRSMLAGIDTEAVIARLRELMELEEAYLDAKLSLQGLASRLAITLHQLSEILNDRLHASFRSFVNAYRVKAEKRMLAEDAKQSILMIAFLCGFNSKNAFYAAFNKEEGMPPSGFPRKGPKAFIAGLSARPGAPPKLSRFRNRGDSHVSRRYSSPRHALGRSPSWTK